MKTSQWIGLLVLMLAVGCLGAAGAEEEPMKECPQCHGAGSTACRSGCDHGMRVCPGKCLKPSVGKWEHLKVEGHDPSELWQTFKTARGTRSWNQHHLGEVIEMHDGDAFNVGK